MSDARFSSAFIAPTKCLRTIDDVLDELTCIKRVLQDQLQVWEKVHSGDNSCLICTGYRSSHEAERKAESEGEETSEVEETREGEEKGHTCPANVLPKRSLELVMRLEEDALKVRESASLCSIARPVRLNKVLTVLDRL